MQQPLVSIVITAYNYGRFLATAIESALGQRYDPLEVIVLDNASTDETPEVIARYAHDPRLRAVRHPSNIGLTPNHNAGLDLARGAYVGFLSADDALAPDFVAHAMRFYREHPDIDVVYGGAYFMTEEGLLVRPREWPGQPRAGYAGGRNELAVLLAEGAYMCLPTMLVPRSVWDRYGPFDADLVSADWDLAARWAAGGIRFAFDPEPFAFVRVHGQQNSGHEKHGATGREMRDYITIFDRHLDPAHPERYAGHEVAIERVIDNRDAYVRTTFGVDAAAEFEAANARHHARVATIAAANRERRRERLAFVVVPDDSLGALQATLEALLALEGGWTAIVVQDGGVSVGPFCRSLGGERIRHAQLPERCNLGAAITTGVNIVDADVYVVLRPGAWVLPGHAAAVLTAFADPETQVAWSSPAVRVQQAAIVTPATDPAVAPPVALEGLAFSHEAFATIGFRDIALPDWDFLIRWTMRAKVHPFAGAIDVHVRPETRYAGLATRGAVRAITEMYHAYPVEDLGRIAARAAFLERLRAAQLHDLHTPAGLREFYAALNSPG